MYPSIPSNSTSPIPSTQSSWSIASLRFAKRKRQSIHISMLLLILAMESSSFHSSKQNNRTGTDWSCSNQFPQPWQYGSTQPSGQLPDQICAIQWFQGVTRQERTYKHKKIANFSLHSKQSPDNRLRIELPEKLQHNADDNLCNNGRLLPHVLPYLLLRQKFLLLFLHEKTLQITSDHNRPLQLL